MMTAGRHAGKREPGDQSAGEPEDQAVVIRYLQ